MAFDFSGFPKSIEQCGLLLIAQEATTGYKTLTLAHGAQLRTNHGPERGFGIYEGEKPIVVFYGDGSRRVKINTLGSVKTGRVARINGALPAPYSIRKASRSALGYELCRDGQPVERFNVSLVFTPEPAALVIAA